MGLCRILISGLLATVFIASEPVTAQPSLSGEIELEDTSTKPRDPFKEAQVNAIEYFHAMEDSLDSTPTAPVMGSSELQYLAAAYLYCSIQRGACPFILDAVLESDIIASHAGGEVRCPNMTGFWKAWVSSDMENRHKYAVRTSFLKVTDDFRTKERPRYLKCKETITALIAGKQGSSDFLRSRYTEPSSAASAIVTTSRYLEELAATVPNVLSAVGISAPKEDPMSGKVAGTAKKGGKSATRRTPTTKKK